MSKAAEYFRLGLAIATLAGCTKADETSEYKGTTRRVPVLSVSVQRGDKLERLLRHEISNSPGRFGIRVSHQNFPYFTMYGDDHDRPSSPTDRRSITYEFSLDGIMKTLNPRRFEMEPVSYARLKVGEKLLIPDFSEDGTIVGQKGEPAGHLIIKGMRNIRDDKVDKSFEFQPYNR